MMKGEGKRDLKNVIDCYDKTAANYAEKYMDELSGKHLDRILLKAFASENSHRGKMIDLGCGPGQTTKFLSECGVTDLLGLDISPEMVRIAKELNPHIEYDTADMLKMKYEDHVFGSAIAFYSIVHFDYDQVRIAFGEIRRVLKEKGQFLFSFHMGNEVVHRDDWFDQKVDINTYFMEPAKILDLLKETGFEIIDAIEREPYPDAEYPSRRAYVWVTR